MGILHKVHHVRPALQRDHLHNNRGIYLIRIRIRALHLANLEPYHTQGQQTFKQTKKVLNIFNPTKFNAEKFFTNIFKNFQNQMFYDFIALFCRTCYFRKINIIRPEPDQQHYFLFC